MTTRKLRYSGHIEERSLPPAMAGKLRAPPALEAKEKKMRRTASVGMTGLNLLP
jgi:hypothetical protein